MLPPPDPQVRPVGLDDLEHLQRLFDSDPAAGDLFHAGPLDDGWYRGIAAADGTLLSVAGTHVVDPGTARRRPAGRAQRGGGRPRCAGALRV